MSLTGCRWELTVNATAGITNTSMKSNTRTETTAKLREMSVPKKCTKVGGTWEMETMPREVPGQWESRLLQFLLPSSGSPK